MSLLDALAYAHSHDVYLLWALPARSSQPAITVSWRCPPHPGRPDGCVPSATPSRSPFSAPSELIGIAATVREDLYALGSLIWFQIGARSRTGSAVQTCWSSKTAVTPRVFRRSFLLKGFNCPLCCASRPQRPLSDRPAAACCLGRSTSGGALAAVRATLRVGGSVLEPSADVDGAHLRTQPDQSCAVLLRARQRERDQPAGVHEAIEGETVSGCVVLAAASSRPGLAKALVVETGGQSFGCAATHPKPRRRNERADPRRLGDRCRAAPGDVIAALNTAGIVVAMSKTLASMIAAPRLGGLLQAERSDDRHAVVARLLARLGIKPW